MTDTTNGQPAAGTETTTPTGTGGEVTTQQTTGETGTGGAAEETFFDPKSIEGKPELVDAYKQMQRAFSEKTAAIASQRDKIDAFDKFASNPLEAIKSLASQYGLTIQQAAAVASNAAAAAGGTSNQFQPQNWDEVFNRAKDITKQEVLKELQPVFNEIRATKKTIIEKQLDESCPDWKVYEDQMKDTLSKHPSLVNDPVMLYEMSLPKNVREARAYQQALRKLEDKGRGAQVSSGSNTNRSAPNGSGGKMSFAEAVAFAKADLAAKGMHEPRQ